MLRFLNCSSNLDSIAVSLFSNSELQRDEQACLLKFSSVPVFTRLLLSALAQVDLLQSSVLCEAFFSLVSLTIGRLSLSSFLLQMARRCAAARLGLALNCSFLPKDTLCFTLDYVLCSNSGGLHQQASLNTLSSAPFFLPVLLPLHDNALDKAKQEHGV